MGGKIALSFAAMQPSGLTSLVLVAPSPPTPEPMTDIERMQLLNAFGDKCALETSVNNITAQPLSNSDIENTVMIIFGLLILHGIGGQKKEAVKIYHLKCQRYGFRY